MKRRSLSKKLFWTYVSWYTLFLVVLIGSTVGFMSYTVNQDISETQSQLIRSMDENIQNYFEEMNAFSLELLNSADFKQTAISRIPEEYEGKKSTAESFSRLYREAYKMIPLRYNVGVLIDEDYYIWMGKYYYIGRLEEEVHTYDNLVRNEIPVVKYLETNEYLEKTSPRGTTGQSYITLSRSMHQGNVYLGGRAVLEIMVEEEEFVSEMLKLSARESEAGIKMNIYDSDGKVLYRESEMDLAEYAKSREEGDYHSDGNMIAVRKIFDDRISIVYTRDGVAYWNRLWKFWAIAVGLSAIVIGITFLVTYKISKEISKPIRVMSENVQQIDLKNGTGDVEIITDIKELQILSKSLSQMRRQIEASMQEIITLKDYEVHAKMLALQAQMQPHFLFNTLMTIAGMAEEEGSERIYRICMNLNSMFRYIASEESDGVRMFEEIRHVESYVEIMKERFPKSRIDIDIPLEMMDCRIPKLTIQPLVENAFKYCNRKKPEIHVKGHIAKDRTWLIEVTDNGPGFSAEKKEEIMNKCRESLENEKALSNQIDGMGMVNVYVRLKLFYGEYMTYRIEENTSRVVIGGIKDGEEASV